MIIWTKHCVGIRHQQHLVIVQMYLNIAFQRFLFHVENEMSSTPKIQTMISVEGYSNKNDFIVLTLEFRLVKHVANEHRTFFLDIFQLDMKTLCCCVLAMK